MTLTDRLLLWRQKRAIKRHKHQTFFKVTKIIARRAAEQMVKEKMKR